MVPHFTQNNEKGLGYKSPNKNTSEKNIYLDECTRTLAVVISGQYIQTFLKDIRRPLPGAAPVAQRFSAACSPGRDPGDPGSSPTSGSLYGACFSLCLCLCLSLSVSMNK